MVSKGQDGQQSRQDGQQRTRWSAKDKMVSKGQDGQQRTRWSAEQARWSAKDKMGIHLTMYGCFTSPNSANVHNFTNW